MQIVTREQSVVVGHPVTAPFGDLATLVPAAWARVFARQQELPAPRDGVYAEASRHLGGGRYREVAGVLLDRPPAAGGDWAVAEVAAGEYAHHRHEGPVQGIGTSFGLLIDWVRANGREAGDVKLDVGYTAAGDELHHDLYLSLLPRAR